MYEKNLGVKRKSEIPARRDAVKYMVIYEGVLSVGVI